MIKNGLPLVIGEGSPGFISSMDNLPLFIGGGGSDAASSSRPLPDLNLPPAPQPLPDLNLPPAAPEPIMPVIIPELPYPLIPDDIRFQELNAKIALYLMDSPPLSGQEQREIILAQAFVEKKVEAALVMDGFNPQALVAKRGQIRSFLFYPKGRLLSERTYFNYVKSLDNEGTRNIIPYRRLVRAIDDSYIFF